MARLSLCFMLVASFVCYTLAASTYTTKFDNFDVDQVLNNNRILSSYIKCLLDEGTCTNEGRELRSILPDALQTECSKCNDVQKVKAEKVIRFLVKNNTADFDRLAAKFDPTGEYKKKLEKYDQEQKSKQ